METHSSSFETTYLTISETRRIPCIAWI